VVSLDVDRVETTPGVLGAPAVQRGETSSDREE
jgi:hypothetical protein